jgi:hypothetical protein
MIGRRKLMTLLGTAAMALPLTAGAQQAGKLPTIGYLSSGTPASQRASIALLATGLKRHKRSSVANRRLRFVE